VRHLAASVEMKESPLVKVAVPMPREKLKSLAPTNVEGMLWLLIFPCDRRKRDTAFPLTRRMKAELGRGQAMPGGPYSAAIPLTEGPHGRDHFCWQCCGGALLAIQAKLR
jgi:hypothetical protein